MSHVVLTVLWKGNNEGLRNSLKIKEYKNKVVWILKSWVSETGFTSQF